MSSQKNIDYRTAPAVDDLNDIKNILINLEFTAIPFTWIDNFKKIKKNLENSNPEVIDDFLNWETRNGFKNFKGYFSELVYLLRTLGIIHDRKITKFDLETPLGVDGPYLNTLNPSTSIQVQELTVLGKELCDILIANNNELFKITLFWTFMTHKQNIQNTNLKPLMPVWQIILSHPHSVENLHIKDVLKQFTTDTYTINSFRKWSEYFNLCSIVKKDSETILILDRQKLSLKIFQAIIIDLNHNFISKMGYNVDDIISKLETNFNLPSLIINYRRILQIIFETVSRNIIEGTFTGRGEKLLFEDKRINKLKIISKIPISPFSALSDSLINSFLEEQS